MSADAPAPEKNNSQWLSLVGLLVIIAGVALAWYGYHIRQLATASQAWPKATGKILKSYVAEQRERDQQTNVVETEYQAKVEYEYHVDGVRYEGKRIRFTGSPGTKVQSEARAVEALYPVDAAVDVFYDPLDPKTSVLDRSFSPFGVSLVIGMGICVVIFGAVLIVRSRITS